MRPRLTYANVVSTLCLCLLLGGGTALAANTIGSSDVIDESLLSQDIKNGEVKIADIGQGAVATDELANGQVKTADIGDGEVMTADIGGGQVKNGDIGSGEVHSGNVANDNLTGGDVAPNSLKGADIDETTLDIGDSARAYAVVNTAGCSSPPSGTCSAVFQKRGISSVTRIDTGRYCVEATGIDSGDVPAMVTVEWTSTTSPEGNASAMTVEGETCGGTGKGFVVTTEFQPDLAVDAGGGTNNAVAVGPATPADDVSFAIMIP